MAMIPRGPTGIVSTFSAVFLGILTAPPKFLRHYNTTTIGESKPENEKFQRIDRINRRFVVFCGEYEQESGSRPRLQHKCR